MKLIYLAAWSFLALTAVVPSRLQAQSPCIGVAEFDSLGAYLLRKVATYTEPNHAAYDNARKDMGLPLAAANTLTVVTNSATCQKAAAAYAAKVSGIGGGLSGRVLVVKAGTTYVVLDPNYYRLASNKQYAHMVMTSKFKVGVIF